MESSRGPGLVSVANLEVLYEAYHRQAIGLAYRLLGNAADAEEVVQEAFLSAWRAGASYDGALGSTRTWLLTIVRHRSIDLLRTRTRRPTDSLDRAFDWPDASDVAAVATAAVDGQAAHAALARLSPEQREALWLAYFGGLTQTEIAARLGLPLGTVKGRIRLALDQLRLALDVEQPTASATAPVLVVDDDPAIRRFIGRALGEEGMPVVMAVDGRQALDRARHQPPALVVLDLHLPRLEGGKVAEALRTAGGQDLPILLISVDRAVSQKATEVGAYAYLEKPFELDDLLSRVRSGLVSRQTGPNRAQLASPA